MGVTLQSWSIDMVVICINAALDWFKALLLACGYWEYLLFALGLLCIVINLMGFNALGQLRISDRSSYRSSRSDTPGIDGPRSLSAGRD